MRPSRRTRVAIGLVLTGTLLATACGGDDGGSSSTPTSGETPDVIVRNDDALKFDKKTYSATAGDVTIELLNDPGQILHTLRIEEQKSFKLEVSGKGKRDSDTIDLKPGTYTLYCDVPGHRSAGMEAKLIVT